MPEYQQAAAMANLATKFHNFGATMNKALSCVTMCCTSDGGKHEEATSKMIREYRVHTYMGVTSP